jgi:hypothetical protein
MAAVGSGTDRDVIEVMQVAQRQSFTVVVSGVREVNRDACSDFSVDVIV